MLISVVVTIRVNTRFGITRHRTSAAAALIACASIAGVINAQPASVPAESVNVDISDCLDLETREQQIACYLARADEAVEAHVPGATAAGNHDPGEPSGASSPARSDPPSAPNRPAQPQSRQQPAPPAAAAASEAPDEAETEIVATITSVREVQPNVYAIELDNGQAWRQSSPKRYFLREGAEVRLVPTRWGESYRLTDPDVGNFIQVERVR
jgi:hypothetical protein